MSIINKKAEMTAADYLKEKIQATTCKWVLTEEERLFIENY